jgi:ABC-type antimicrobial peptide transport system permease subunit
VIVSGSLRTAVKALGRNPMRALLTTLGIVIGIAAVIAMMEIGAGSSAAIRKAVASMGANIVMIGPGAAATSGATLGAGSAPTLTADDCEAILTECPAVRSAAPIVHCRTQVICGNRNWSPFWMEGTTPKFLDVREWPVVEGEPFTEHDVRSANQVCLVGQTLVRELFEGRSPIGEELRVNNVPLRVVGVLAAKGANAMGMDTDDTLVTPWTTMKYRIAASTLANANQSSSSGSASGSVNTLSNLYPGSQPSLYPEKSTIQTADNPMPVRFSNISLILAAARGPQEIPAAMQQIAGLLRDRHRIRPGRPDDFEIRDSTEMSNALSSTTVLMTNLLLCVAMISLVVGGVGIMNIMLVSVTERTREIGLRMAVGAEGRDILCQFLIEAVLLCLVGGAMGILLGHGGSCLVETLLHWPVETSPMAIAAAVIVSATVGTTFGFYPAWKASRLDPIEALRYE